MSYRFRCGSHWMLSGHCKICLWWQLCETYENNARTLCPWRWHQFPNDCYARGQFSALCMLKSCGIYLTAYVLIAFDTQCVGLESLWILERNLWSIRSWLWVWQSHHQWWKTRKWLNSARFYAWFYSNRHQWRQNRNRAMKTIEHSIYVEFY